MTIKNLIENVTIIDGLGNEPFKGNVLIENNLISKIYKNQCKRMKINGKQ